MTKLFKIFTSITKITLSPSHKSIVIFCYILYIFLLIFLYSKIVFLNNYFKKYLNNNNKKKVKVLIVGLF